MPQRRPSIGYPKAVAWGDELYLDGEMRTAHRAVTLSNEWEFEKFFEEAKRVAAYRDDSCSPSPT
jgi:hypothetical protein